jgi:broad specificity phosphatase PhoE
MAMGVNLVIVRHGRTEWNREVRFRGKTDLPLDQVGLAQAGALAGAIRGRWPVVAAVYSSPLLRARQTAEPVATALGQAVQVHAGLCDVDYGSWTGMTPAEVEARDPELHRLWRTAPEQVQFPDGETLRDVQQRLEQLLQEMEYAHSAQTVVLVGHIVVNRVLLCTLLGQGLNAFWRIDQDNGAISTARWARGIGVVASLNDTCHLQGEVPQGGPHV